MIVNFTKFVLTSLLSLEMTLFNLVNIQPLALTPGTTTAYGSYSAQTYRTQTSDAFTSFSIGIPPFNVEFSDDSASAFHLTYQLKQNYSGYIDITVTASRAYVLNDCSFGISGGWFTTIPSLTSSTTAKTFRISFLDSNYIDFIIVRENDSLTSATFNDSTTFTLTFYQTTNTNELSVLQSIASTLNSKLDFKLSDMENTLNEIVIGGAIPIEMVPAFVFMSADYNNVSRDTGIYPRIVSTGSLTSRTVRLYPGEPIEFYYIASTSGFNSTFSNSSVTYSWERLRDYNISGASVYKSVMNYEGTNTAGVTGQLTISQTSGGWIIPVYYGSGNGMSDNLRSVLGLDDPSVTYLSAIFDLLSAYFDSVEVPEDPNRVNTAPYLNAVKAVQTFFSDMESLFGGGISQGGGSNSDVRNDIISAIDNVDDNVQTNTFLAISEFVQSVYTDLNTTIPSFGLLTVFGMVVLIIGVFN